MFSSEDGEHGRQKRQNAKCKECQILRQATLLVILKALPIAFSRHLKKKNQSKSRLLGRASPLCMRDLISNVFQDMHWTILQILAGQKPLT